MSQTGLRVKKESFMTQSIKLTTDQMRLMSLFQNVTGATARDCVEDEKQNRVIFVVNTGKMGLAIGKGGSHIKTLQNIVKQNVELVEYADDPAVFLKNMLNSKLILEVKINKKTIFGHLFLETKNCFTHGFI